MEQPELSNATKETAPSLAQTDATGATNETEPEWTGLERRLAAARVKHHSADEAFTPPSGSESGSVHGDVDDTQSFTSGQEATEVSYSVATSILSYQLQAPEDVLADLVDKPHWKDWVYWKDVILDRYKLLKPLYKALSEGHGPSYEFDPVLGQTVPRGDAYQMETLDMIVEALKRTREILASMEVDMTYWQEETPVLDYVTAKIKTARDTLDYFEKGELTDAARSKGIDYIILDMEGVSLQVDVNAKGVSKGGPSGEWTGPYPESYSASEDGASDNGADISEQGAGDAKD